jgi:Calx-beta domain/Bacterial Ig-like domain (group 2)
MFRSLRRFFCSVVSVLLLSGFIATAATAQELPQLSISDASVLEGNAGRQTMVFLVTLSGPLQRRLTVDWETQDGTATEGDRDYRGASGTLRFVRGQSSATVSVNVRGDTNVEPDENFRVVLSNATGATVPAPASGFIVNDDQAATLTSVTLRSNAPTSVSAGIGLSVTATAQYSDGRRVNVTDEAQWTVSNANATVTNQVPKGFVRTFLNGTSVVSAAFGGQTGSITITILPARINEIRAIPNPVVVPRGASVPALFVANYTDGTELPFAASPLLVVNAPNSAIATYVEGSVTGVRVGTTSMRVRIPGGPFASIRIVVTEATATTTTVASTTTTTVAPTTTTTPTTSTTSTTSTTVAPTTTTTSTTAAPTTTTTSTTAAPTTTTTSTTSTTSTTVAPTITTTSTTAAPTTTTTTTVAPTTTTTAPTTTTTTTPASPPLTIIQEGSSADRYQFAANLQNGELAPRSEVVWSSSDTTVGTIDNYTELPVFSFGGEFTKGRAGQTTITATYGGFVATRIVTVGVRATGLTLTPSTATLVRSSTLNLTATASQNNGVDLNATAIASYSSSNPNVATVDATGKVTAVSASPFAVTIFASYVDAEDRNFLASTLITVTNPPATVSSITLMAPTGVPVGETYIVRGTVNFANGTSAALTQSTAATGSPVWVVASNGAAALFDATSQADRGGWITVLQPGSSATVTVSYQGVSATITTPTLSPVASIALSLNSGQTLRVSATLTNGAQVDVTALAGLAITSSVPRFRVDRLVDTWRIIDTALGGPPGPGTVLTAVLTGAIQSVTTQLPYNPPPQFPFPG